MDSDLKQNTVDNLRFLRSRVSRAMRDIDSEHPGESEGVKEQIFWNRMSKLPGTKRSYQTALTRGTGEYGRMHPGRTAKFLTKSLAERIDTVISSLIAADVGGAPEPSPESTNGTDSADSLANQSMSQSRDTFSDVPPVHSRNASQGSGSVKSGESNAGRNTGDGKGAGAGAGAGTGTAPEPAEGMPKGKPLAGTGWEHFDAPRPSGSAALRRFGNRTPAMSRAFSPMPTARRMRTGGNDADAGAAVPGATGNLSAYGGNYFRKEAASAARAAFDDRAKKCARRLTRLITTISPSTTSHRIQGSKLARELISKRVNLGERIKKLEEGAGFVLVASDCSGSCDGVVDFTSGIAMAVAQHHPRAIFYLHSNGEPIGLAGSRLKSLGLAPIPPGTEHVETIKTHRTLLDLAATGKLKCLINLGDSDAAWMLGQFACLMPTIAVDGTNELGIGNRARTTNRNRCAEYADAMIRTLPVINDINSTTMSDEYCYYRKVIEQSFRENPDTITGWKQGTIAATVAHANRARATLPLIATVLESELHAHRFDIAGKVFDACGDIYTALSGNYPNQ